MVFSMISSNFLPERLTDKLVGIVERVTFHSEETGFCVLRTQVKGRRGLVTVIGFAPRVKAGEYVECIGQWINNKKHGLQFKAKELRLLPPSTLDGIRKYLSSGMIKGIGPYFAKKLVKAFGENVLEVITKQPEKILNLHGIGEKRCHLITQSWKKHCAIQDIMIFLQSYGIGTAKAVRIYKTYGDESIERIRENPYCLTTDVHGIGFKTADALALNLAIPKESLIRAQAGVRYVLQNLCECGHCAVACDVLTKKSVELLEISEPIVCEAIKQEMKADHFIQDEIDSTPVVFLSFLYHAENGVARHVHRLNQGRLPWGKIDIDRAIPWVEQQTRLQLSDSQKAAIRTVLTNKVSIITGGPGVGKTTIINSLLKIIRAKRLKVALCAPTGRAAKRLSETTHLSAKTIHRLLAFDPTNFSFKHHQHDPLKTDFVVIDEASMVDVLLMYHLLKAVPDQAALLYVGDVDQLPSVGPGRVLGDLIDANVISVVRLKKIFRQAASSKIIINAHRINQSKLPFTPLSKEAASNVSDFYAIYVDTPEEIRDKLIKVVTERIPKRFGYDPIKDVQVLTPMNRGGLGTHSLNIELQKQLNSNSEPKVERYGLTFSPRDKIIQLVNNYDKEIFNGDVGTIVRIDLVEKNVHIKFDHRIVTYSVDELDEITLAYATTIHKSQGAEYPVVVIPVAVSHYRLLAKNLLYTGVTRGKKLVVLIGQKKAVAMAIHNQRAEARLTKLSLRLKELHCLSPSLS
jgi:exodeoxyribonuclease V alpha subunit